MGAPEIELDLWPDKDGHLIVCHDPKVDRTTDGSGMICDLTARSRRWTPVPGFLPLIKGYAFRCLRKCYRWLRDGRY